MGGKSFLALFRLGFVGKNPERTQQDLQTIEENSLDPLEYILEMVKIFF